MSQRNLYIIAAIVDTILLIAFLLIVSLVINSPVADEKLGATNASAESGLASPTDTVTPTETLVRIPVITVTPTPTESATLTPIPSPTRILPEEPTKAPYMFQTPVFIPPNMRDNLAPTPTRTRTR
jgi:hypothetical protein